MFQVIFPMPKGTKYIEEVNIFHLPWVIYKNNSDQVYICNFLENVVIGSIDVFPFKVIIKVDETLKPLGYNFWIDFAKLYPELNPFEKHYGVVRPVDRLDETYELDDIPKNLPAESMDKVADGEDSDAFFVQYYLGDWHPKEELKVISHAHILGKGRVGHKMAERTFKLV